MRLETSPANPLKVLRLQWAGFAALGLAVWLGFFAWLTSWQETPDALRWLGISGLALAYLLGALWRGLEDNHRPGESALLPGLGLGNTLSLSRGMILALFCGFLFSPWPDQGWTVWLPGLLYTLAALPDYADGAAARLTNHVTQLGETLDGAIDSLGVLGVSLLSVQYGQVPWWYLPVGLARYLFLAGIWLRQKLGLPVFPLAPSVRRRGYAALTMGLFFVVLYPIFRPPVTHLAATIFALYLLGGFLWDWFVTIGRIPPQPGRRYQRLERFAVQTLPLLLRLLLLTWFLAVFPRVWLISPPSALLYAQALAALCLILGVAGRMTAIAALVILGLQQTTAPLSGLDLGMVIVYANLLFLGTGAYALWPVEDRLIYHRLGDPS